jgi:hypothetical protein
LSYRAWTRQEINEIIELKRDGWKWGKIAKKFGADSENVRAAYRRAVGAKQSAYKALTPIHFTADSPKVAVLDIETLPMVCYSWGLFDQNISIDQVIRDSCMLSWAGKYLNSHEMFSDVMTPDEAISRDSTRITKSIWEFLHNADVVIGHNFAGFDFKYINTEFLKHDLPPLRYIIIDTFLIAKQNFRFASNKMKYINDQLGIRNKVDNDGFPLWKGCSDGDANSLKVMLEYNCGDIGATEELFYRVRPYVKGFNVSLYNEMATEQCPVCGSDRVKHEGWYYTPAGMWESMRCASCKCLSRKKENHLDKEKRKTLLVKI